MDRHKFDKPVLTLNDPCVTNAEARGDEDAGDWELSWISDGPMPGPSSQALTRDAKLQSAGSTVNFVPIWIPVLYGDEILGPICLMGRRRRV